MNQLLELRSLHTPQTLTELVLVAVVLGGIFLTMRQLNGAGFAVVMALIALAAFVVDAHIFIPLSLLTAGIITLYRPVASRPTRHAGRFALDFLIIFTGFIIYELGRIYSEGTIDSALSNARRVVHIQRLSGLPDEVTVQSIFIRFDAVTELFNLTYSFMFLSMVAGMLVWLYLNDDRDFLIYRNALAISAFFTVLISWLFPVAPPRLNPPFNIIDTHVQMGHEHGFVNEFAAMPSLHVGWTVLVGVFIVRAVGGRRGWTLGILPVALISLTVIVTGNHFWLDGVSGAAVCLVAFALALLLAHRHPEGMPVPAVASRTQRRVRDSAAPIAVTALARCGAACRAITALTIMFAYLIIGQIVAPGFTDHWGYLVAQVGATLAIVVAAEYALRLDGGLFSWQTLLAICAATALDLFGTSEDLYANHASYDKIVHFVGTACFTAVVLDVLGKMSTHRKLSWNRSQIITIGVLIGISAGIAWEIYEYVGDHVFNSARTGGFWDTTYDLIFDAFGAVAIGIMFLFSRWFNWGIFDYFRWDEAGQSIDPSDQATSDTLMQQPNPDTTSE